MASITNPANIPAKVRDDLKDVLRSIGPAVLDDRWPADVDPENLTNTELAQVFEQVTREFWRQQIQAHKAEVAAAAARASALESSNADPFG